MINITIFYFLNQCVGYYSVQNSSRDSKCWSKFSCCFSNCFN